MKRLTTKHPTYKKFSQLAEFAEKLGLTITFRNSFGVDIHDNEFPNTRFELQDLESTDQREAPNDFPPVMEYKIVRLEEGE
jgi:hypothetical protein